MTNRQHIEKLIGYDEAMLTTCSRADDRAALVADVEVLRAEHRRLLGLPGGLTGRKPGPETEARSARAR